MRKRKGKKRNLPICSVHKGAIYGKVFYWHHQKMCKNCRRRFSTIEVKKQPQKDNRGLIARIFNW